MRCLCLVIVVVVITVVVLIIRCRCKILDLSSWFTGTERGLESVPEIMNIEVMTLLLIKNKL